MDGEPASDAIVAYLSRLTGEAVSPDRPVRLRSVQRAAFASWSRKQDIKLSFGAIRTGEPFHIRDLFPGDENPLPARPGPKAAFMQTDNTPASPPTLSVGIDIEEVGNLPRADDYREHPFYRDNFTPGEIAHCIRQADVRASLCGTWAAKEAVIKAGLAAPPGGLSAIEITHDGAGRPVYPNCRLSISHTATTAVAVCIAWMENPPAQT